MTREEIIEKLKELMKFAMPAKADVVDASSEDSNLMTDIGLNSVGLLYIAIAVEEFFNVSFDDVTFNDFQTVKDVVDFIQKNS